MTRASFVPRALCAASLVLSSLVACGDDDDGPSTPPATSALTLHDVSVLFPLPTSAGEIDRLWGLDEAGRGGPLVPGAILDALPQLGASERSITGMTPAAERPLLRAVSLRLDPCFRGTDASPCTPQLRLVFQAIVPEGPLTQGIEALDGSVHAFYTLDDAELDATIGELEALAALAPENADVTTLGVSPALAAQGLDGAYARGLRQLVLRHCGAANLSRVAFMMAPAFLQWSFGVLEPRDGTWGLVALVDGETQHEDLVIEGPFDGGFHYAPSPVLLGDALAPALSSTTIRGLDAEARGALFTALAHTADPAGLRPDAASCLACHLTPHALDLVVELEPSLADPSWAPRARAPGDRDPTSFRMFGYFAATPVVGQRVANDTRATLAAIEAR